MKKLLFLALTLSALLWLTAAGAGLAHPPSDIQVKYQAKTQLLNITVFHNVKDPKTHYIKEIEVILNGEKIIVQNFSQQSGAQTQLAVYQLYGVKPGDKVSVEAECSKFGVLSKDFKI